MFPPVRCYTCCAPIGQRFDHFFAQIRRGGHADEVLDAMEMDTCCRIHFITAPCELANMCVMMSNETVHEVGCEFVETTRPPQNTIRVQRVVDRQP